MPRKYPIGLKCACPGCENQASSLGYCKPHRERLRKTGELSPEIPLRSRKEVRAWVRSHIGHEGGDCLIWPFGRSGSGYGSHRAEVDGVRYVHAHSVMCAHRHGPRPAGTEAAHSCGNGHLGCVNPQHLSWKTPAENQRDKVVHGTHNRGSRHPLSKLTEDDVLRIRASTESHVALAKRFRVSAANILHIRHNDTWTHLPSASRLAENARVAALGE